MRLVFRGEFFDDRPNLVDPADEVGVAAVLLVRRESELFADFGGGKLEIVQRLQEVKRADELRIERDSVDFIIGGRAGRRVEPRRLHPPFVQLRKSRLELRERAAAAHRPNTERFEHLRVVDEEDRIVLCSGGIEDHAREPVDRRPAADRGFAGKLQKLMTGERIHGHLAAVFHHRNGLEFVEGAQRRRGGRERRRESEPDGKEAAFDPLLHASRVG